MAPRNAPVTRSSRVLAFLARAPRQIWRAGREQTRYMDGGDIFKAVAMTAGAAALGWWLFWPGMGTQEAGEDMAHLPATPGTVWDGTYSAITADEDLSIWQNGDDWDFDSLGSIEEGQTIWPLGRWEENDSYLVVRTADNKMGFINARLTTARHIEAEPRDAILATTNKQTDMADLRYFDALPEIPGTLENGTRLSIIGTRIPAGFKVETTRDATGQPVLTITNPDATSDRYIVRDAQGRLAEQDREDLLPAADYLRAECMGSAITDEACGGTDAIEKLPEWDGTTEAVVTSSALWLMSGPGDDARRLTLLNAGTILPEWRLEDGDNITIPFGNAGRGWLKTSGLMKAWPATDPGPVTVQYGEDADDAAMQLHTGPGDNSYFRMDIPLEPGTRLQLVGETENGWALVETGLGIPGYILRSSLQTVEEAADARNTAMREAERAARKAAGAGAPAPK